MLVYSLIKLATYPQGKKVFVQGPRKRRERSVIWCTLIRIPCFSWYISQLLISLLVNCTSPVDKPSIQVLWLRENCKGAVKSTHGAEGILISSLFK